MLNWASVCFSLRLLAAVLCSVTAVCIRGRGLHWPQDPLFSLQGNPSNVQIWKCRATYSCLGMLQTPSQSEALMSASEVLLYIWNYMSTESLMEKWQLNSYDFFAFNQVLDLIYSCICFQLAILCLIDCKRLKIKSYYIKLWNVLLFS